MLERRDINSYNDELYINNLTSGYDYKILEEILRVLKKVNLYIFCNGEQIPFYIRFFVLERKCKMDIIIWNKTNALPLFNNKYLSDKEYCLYFVKVDIVHQKVMKILRQYFYIQ